MQQTAMIGILAAALLMGADRLHANCMVIDNINRLYTIQSRLARDPDTGLFETDLRLLRVTLRSLNSTAALEAVDGSALFERGADIVRMLEQTQALLDSASLDDPDSVRPHFQGSARRTLAAVGDHLHDLRCTSEQISIDRAAAAAEATAPATATDEEELAQVLQALGTFGQEALRPRNLIGLLLTIGAGVAVAPIVKRWLILRRRWAKRHPANYATRYRKDELTIKSHLLDINCYGTKLARPKDQKLEVGDGIEIAIEDSWIAGRVIWSNQHYSGVQFKRAIGLGEVTEIIANSTQR